MIEFRRRSHASISASEGYVLVSILWILGVVAAGVACMSLFNVASLRVLSSSSEKLKAEALARSDLEYAIYLIAGSDPKKGLKGEAIWRADAGSVSVTWMGETGRIDINSAAPPLIKGLLMSVAQDEGRADDAMA